VTVKLNHTIVASSNNRKSALFLSQMLNLEPPRVFGHFVLVTVGDELTLDYIQTSDPIVTQHYAFLVSEAEFDEIFDHIKRRNLCHWADPMREKAGEINRWDDGRGVYFDDPDGHLLEILTRPYGSKGMSAEQPHPLVARTVESNSSRNEPASQVISSSRLARDRWHEPC
jgi:catechol 2,3-dioxygenase-like lactoylglutathione lyase family enzyme